ncbi:MAG: hypothetical protein LBQ04_00175, partial [Endomicrobium sp.]|nr:hypothetical protein [Endomicrobium sp.]
STSTPFINPFRKVSTYLGNVTQCNVTTPVDSSILKYKFGRPKSEPSPAPTTVTTHSPAPDPEEEQSNLIRNIAITYGLLIGAVKTVLSIPNNKVLVVFNFVRSMMQIFSLVEAFSIIYPEPTSKPTSTPTFVNGSDLANVSTPAPTPVSYKTYKPVFQRIRTILSREYWNAHHFYSSQGRPAPRGMIRHILLENGITQDAIDAYRKAAGAKHAFGTAIIFEVYGVMIFGLSLAVPLADMRNHRVRNMDLPTNDEYYFSIAVGMGLGLVMMVLNGITLWEQLWNGYLSLTDLLFMRLDY